MVGGFFDANLPKHLTASPEHGRGDEVGTSAGQSPAS